MIETFEGRIGGGKSYSAIERMFAHWLRGGAVYSNLPVVWDECKKFVLEEYGVELVDGQFTALTNAQICTFPQHTPTGTMELPVLVVVDEAHLWLFSSTEKRGAEVRALLEFLTMSRHLHTDVIFITQAAKNIDVKISRLNQYIWRFRDMRKWKIPALGIAYPFNHTRQVCFDGTDGRTIMESRYCLRDARVFRCYDSHALHLPVARLEGTLTKFAVRKVRKKVRVPTWVVVVLWVSAVGLIIAV